MSQQHKIILPNIKKWSYLCTAFINLLIPESAAQVGNSSEDAACSMAAKHGHSKVRMQDTHSAQRGPPQPPIPHTTSPHLHNIYLRQQRYFLTLPLLLSSNREPGGAGGSGSVEVVHEAGHGNVYVS